MAKVEKEYTILITRRGVTREITGTLEYLKQYFKYTLECGQSWEHEKGNHKINTNPKSISALVNNINWAVNNSAANGYANDYYKLKKDLH